MKRRCQALLLMVIAAALMGCTKSEQVRTVDAAAAIGPGENKLRVGGTVVAVEIAATEKDRARGLMFRESLGKDTGMLFIYPEPRTLSFWMKNTIIPLSIAFIDSDGNVVNTLEMKPLIEVPPYRSTRPCRFALEMAAGWFSEHRVKAGDRVEIPEHIRRLESEP